MALAILAYSFSVFAENIQGFDLASGQSVQMETAASKATVIVFLSARCPCSASHENELKKLSEEFSSKGFRFIGVHSNSDEQTDKDAVHFKEVSLGFPVLRDADQKLADRFGAFKTPHVFVISPRGETLYAGGVSDSSDFGSARKKYLRENLSRIENRQKADPEKTMAVGCMIRR